MFVIPLWMLATESTDIQLLETVTRQYLQSAKSLVSVNARFMDEREGGGGGIRGGGGGGGRLGGGGATRVLVLGGGVSRPHVGNYRTTFCSSSICY